MSDVNYIDYFYNGARVFQATEHASAAASSVGFSFGQILGFVFIGLIFCTIFVVFIALLVRQARKR